MERRKESVEWRILESADREKQLMMTSVLLPSLLRTLVSRHARSVRPLTSSRLFSSDSSGYDGDGKTIVSVVNEEERQRTLIDSYSKMGFRLNSGLFVIGPVAVFPQMVLQWDVVDVRDISARSLSLFWLLEPKIDLLVIGVGDADVLSGMKLETRMFMKRKGINMEVLATPDAVASFNFLNADYRNVAAALIPPKRNYIFSDAEAQDQFLVKDQLWKSDWRIEDAERRTWEYEKHHAEQHEKWFEDKLAEEHRNKKY